MRADACVRLVRPRGKRGLAQQLQSALHEMRSIWVYALLLIPASEMSKFAEGQSVCAQGEDSLEEVVDVKRGGVTPQGQS